MWVIIVGDYIVNFCNMFIIEIKCKVFHYECGLFLSGFGHLLLHSFLPNPIWEVIKKKIIDYTHKQINKYTTHG